MITEVVLIPPYIPPICVVCCTRLLRITVLFEVPMTVAPELFKGNEHVMLIEPIHCLIIEIKYEKTLHITKNNTLAWLT